jgi:hypothetical protein
MAPVLISAYALVSAQEQAVAVARAWLRERKSVPIEVRTPKRATEAETVPTMLECRRASVRSAADKDGPCKAGKRATHVDRRRASCET